MVVSLKSNLVYFYQIEIQAEIDTFLQYHNLQILHELVKIFSLKQTKDVSDKFGASFN